MRQVVSNHPIRAVKTFEVKHPRVTVVLRLVREIVAKSSEQGTAAAAEHRADAIRPMVRREEHANEAAAPRRKGAPERSKALLGRTVPVRDDAIVHRTSAYYLKPTRNSLEGKRAEGG